MVNLIGVLKFPLQYHENLGMSGHVWPHPTKSTYLNIFLTQCIFTFPSSKQSIKSFWIHHWSENHIDFDL